MAIYPGEIHFFRRAFVLRNAWKRSDAFFDRYLMEPNGAVSEKIDEGIVISRFVTTGGQH
jgi:hypothetical protein